MAVLSLLVTGCTAEISDSSAAYFAAHRPAAVSSVPPVDAGVLAPRAAAGRGPVSRPDLGLSPGAIAEGDVTLVCKQPKRVHTPIPYLEQKAIFDAYKIAYPKDAKKYGLDYLIPIDLGGKPVAANIWPAAHKGIGFHEKQRLNSRLRELVCQGTVPLDKVQQQLVSDWYLLWLQYGA